MFVYRLASYATPLRTEPARRPGRYHTGAEPTPTQYACLHPLGPFAELMRAHSLRSPEQILQVRARTWALRLETDRLLKITFDTAPEVGLRAEDLVADDQGRCRELAGELRLRGVPGAIVPSAALPGTRNVVLFGACVASPYLLDPVGPVDAPASITADGGRPALGLLERVRFRGQPHAALAAWRRGVPFALEEPDWELAMPAGA